MVTGASTEAPGTVNRARALLVFTNGVTTKEITCKK
jgi:hypothetical protein